MARSIVKRLLSRFEALLARLGHTFIDRWGRLERGYRRPAARAALRLGFLFYPLLAVLALTWLAWDWTHDRKLAAAENAIFDRVITLRPWEPKPSSRVVVVEIDECSIEHYRAKGEGGWPWSRQRHADLLDTLDIAGARAVGYDVLFGDLSSQDPVADSTLEALADGGEGRVVFASKRLPDDASSQLRVSRAPSAFVPLDGRHAGAGIAAANDPTVALLLPYGEAMARNSALVDITRSSDGVLRDIPLREMVGGWGLPTLPLRVAVGPDTERMRAQPASVRVNWRSHSRLPKISAADLLEGAPICRDPATPVPDLRDRIVLVGYTAAGLNDSKPTPVDAAMPGVEVWAEAAEAVLTGNAIWMPPAWVKYLLAGLLVTLTGYAFFRGEPAWELDQAFVATNLALLLVAFAGITASGVFLDIFAAIGFVSLCFGLCRVYAATQRGYAIGNDDYRPGFDPDRDPWLVLARVRFVPDPGLAPHALERRLREFRRRLRRWMFRGTEAVALDCVVEYDSWFWDSLVDVTVLVWSGTDREAVVASARRELDALHAHLAGHEDLLPDDGSVRIACILSTAQDDEESASTARVRVCEALGSLLRAEGERPLRPRNTFMESVGEHLAAPVVLRAMDAAPAGQAREA